MTLEIKIAEALERALSGKTICEKIGYWEVSARHVETLILYLTYRRGKKFLLITYLKLNTGITLYNLQIIIGKRLEG